MVGLADTMDDAFYGALQDDIFHIGVEMSERDEARPADGDVHGDVVGRYLRAVWVGSDLLAVTAEGDGYLGRDFS